MPPRMNTCAQNTFKYTHAYLPLITCAHVILPFTVSLGDYFLTNSLRSTGRKYITENTVQLFQLQSAGTILFDDSSPPMWILITP